MSESARVLAQAKINLLLHVLAQEKSGYHSLETLFQRIDLADAVVVHATASGRALECRGPAIPREGLGETTRNLAYRAADAYQRETGWPGGFAIEVDKRIPVGAGLGGGSADAGAVLRCLDALAPRPLGARLIDVAAAIGADVGFLTAEHALALAWSRGERMMALAPLPSRPVAIIVPDFSVSTADAYAWLAASRAQFAPRARLLSPGALAGWQEVATLASNDFEATVSERHPVIDEITHSLRERGSRMALMSGSGSSVFGVFDTMPDVRTMRLPSGCTVLETRTSARVVQVERLQ